MNKINYTTLLASALCCFALSASAQDSLLSLTGSSEFTGLSNEAVAAMNPMELSMAKKSVTLTVNVASSSGIAKIAVMLGNSKGSNDIFYKEFDLGDTGNFDDGTFYHNSGGNLVFGIGTFRGASEYHAEVFAIMENGTRSKSARYVIQ